jgi:hypothetical protein
MGLRASRLRWPEWVVGAGGVVLLLATFLMSWYTLTLSSQPPGPITLIPQQVDGWHGLQIGHWFLLLAVLLALATVFFQAQRRAPALPVALSVMASIFGGVCVLWLVARVLIAPPGGRGMGGWIGLLGAAAITYGGYESVRREGIAPEDGPAEIPRIELSSAAAPSAPGAEPSGT